KVIREFKLTSLALKNKNTVFLLTVILIGFGLFSYFKLPKELFPDINIPTVMVQTIYPGNPPVDMENLVTRPIEKEIESVKGIKKTTSNSTQDASMIFVEFNPDVEINDALQEVKDAVDKAKKELPNDLLEDPSVTDIDFSEFPIININLSGDFSINELKTFAEYLEDKIEPISEISKVEITGLDEREIKINVDPYKLESFELSFTDIENAIAQENVSISGGEIKLGKSRRSIRVIGEFKNTKEIENIIIKSEKGNIVYLKDAAEVVYGFAEPESFARLNKHSVVTLQVIKKGGENLLQATNKIFEILDNAHESKVLPKNLNISITNDQSDIVRKQLSNLENSMILGVILVVLVLYFFLGRRNALFVGAAIPISMFISFMVLGLMDSKINMIVLFSLILALGMLVDNAIVVVENIYRFIDRGYKKADAAKLAVGEIAMPIITSTATTLAAFIPLLFWDSMMGEFMKFLPMTLIIVLSSSLFVALVFIPVLSATFIKPGEQNHHLNKKKLWILAIIMILLSFAFYLFGYNIAGSLLLIFAFIGILNISLLNSASMWFQDVFLVKLELIYLKVLKIALRKNNPSFIIFGTIGLLILTFAFFYIREPNIEFFPSSDPKYVNVLAELPIGTDITATDSTMKVIELKVYEIIEPYQSIVKSIHTVVGKGAVGEFSGFAGRGGGPNKGLITVTFLDYEYRGDFNTSNILKKLSDGLTNKYPGIELSVEKQNEGPPSGKPINIEVSGNEFTELLLLTDTLQTYIKNSGIEGIEGLKIDLDIGKPELIVHIDRDNARRFGLSTGQIAMTLRTALFGKEISDFKVGEEEYPIQLRLNEKYRYDLPALMNQKVTFRSQSSGKIHQVPISAVADIEYSSTYGSVLRIDGKRVITIYSNVLEGYNATNINNQLKELLADFDMPESCKYKFTGEQQEQAESMAFLIKALLIAVCLIILILVTQFNSGVKPLIIMASVLFSTIGVFGGIAIFNMDFIVIMTGLGIVALAGVVVNNAIVLIDYVDLLKKRKRKELGLEENAILKREEATKCVVEGGKTRLRPVLLTAITTILGLLPMALGININFETLLSNFDPQVYFGGDNAAFWGPISWTIIFGLTFATVLTLIVVPAMYHVLYMIKARILKFKT
ncbi:MAG: efflux RND transporter permease subunit, partial [Bacteroidales bacterium]|nr:efflux RND transporter permease subunit [Bacteroidales bacterium]